MIKVTIIIFITFFFSSVLYAKDNYSNAITLDSVDKIPIFSKINIKPSEASEFDSKEGKILILNFVIDEKHEKEMKNFYEKFFKNTNWILKNKHNSLIYFEKKIKQSHKKLIIKRQSNNLWNLNLIVENF